MFKGVTNLFVQIGSVGYKYNARILDICIRIVCRCKCNALGKHYHGKRLARTLRMPNKAALAFTFFIKILNAFKCGTDYKELLITGNLLFAFIKQCVAISDFQQARWLAKTVNQFILFGDLAFCLLTGFAELFKFWFRKKSIFILFRKELVYRSFYFGVLNFQFVPITPEFFRSSHCCVFCIIHANGKQCLAINEQSRNEILTLISKHLRNSLPNTFFGGFIFYDSEGNSVYKENDVWGCAFR